LAFGLLHEPADRGSGPDPPVDLIGITLTGAGLAALIFGFENLGRDELRPGPVAGLFSAGIAAFGLYAWHARRAPHAVIDLTVFRKPTFSASVIGGGFMRVALGANPFLLAMLLQVAFGLSAFTAGLMISVSGIGALLMKATATPILRRLGFRTVLMANAVLVAASFMAYALFTPEWPHWSIMAVLGVAGFLWSLQLTALNALAFADIEQDEMSRAATTASMIQQLVQSIGIGMAAALLHLLMNLRGETQLTAAAIWPAFLIVGLVTMISMVWFVRLPANAGDEMNGRGG
jgi:predicted MFS family arabinose efflux permease